MKSEVPQFPNETIDQWHARRLATGRERGRAMTPAEARKWIDTDRWWFGDPAVSKGVMLGFIDRIEGRTK